MTRTLLQRFNSPVMELERHGWAEFNTRLGKWVITERGARMLRLRETLAIKLSPNGLAYGNDTLPLNDGRV